MAFITLPSGKIVDTNHISYMSRRSHNLSTGGTHSHRTLHMDNNDLIQLNAADTTALDAVLDWHVGSSADEVEDQQE